jgi:uncharacterized protein (DUF58 family)
VARTRPRKAAREDLFDEDFLRRLRHLALAGRRVLAGAAGGAHRATDLGDGLEFADHRDYSPGDELRYVDWNIFGRLDRLQIRLFHRHSEQQVHLLLDGSGSMAAPAAPAGLAAGQTSKEAFAKRCAAGLAYVARANLDHVSIAPWTAGGHSRRELAPVRGRAGRFATILDYLAGLEFAGPGRLADSARAWASRPRSRGLAVLISDCPDPDDLKAAVRRVAHAGQQVAVLHIYSPADAGDAPPGPLAVFDPEQPGSALRVTHDAALRSAYRQHWANYLAHVRSVAHSVGGIHAHSVTSRPWEQFLLACLRQIRLAAV